MMILDEFFTLSNGVRIPKLGYGTWMISDGEAATAVSEAISIGYRHIDTAQAYANERGVGESLRTSRIKRDGIFVTSKLAAESKDYADASERIDRSLQALEVSSVRPLSRFRYGEIGNRTG